MHRVARPDRPTPHDPRVHASHPQIPAHGRVDPAQRVAPEARTELGTSSVGLLADLKQRRTDRKATARRQRVDAQVEVHVELIARERPAVRVLFDRTQDPRADSVTWLSGLACPSGVRLLPRSNQLSPTTPNVVSSSAASTSSRSSTAGRRAISSSRPPSRGAARTSARNGSKSRSVVVSIGAKCRRSGRSP